ncbi:MAG: GIY-YIG nuclease family protein [Candidatus Marinimicrobia bacterium]|nr:GIY-YIG nuclease family protein [Candidatus Neomarinimicrobiota bacterium]
MIDKKEIRRQYKQTIQPMGVYRITNTANGKIFIGSSKNLTGTFNSLRFQLELGSYRNKELQADFTAFGKEKFSFDVVDYLEPKEDPSYNYTKDLEMLEEMWVEKLKPFGDKGYNNIPNHT